MTLTISITSTRPPHSTLCTLPITKETNLAQLTSHYKSQIPKAQHPEFRIANTKINEGDNILELLEKHKIKEIQVKELGRQVAWMTVFLAEYAGPIVIHSIMYWRKQTQLMQT